MTQNPYQGPPPGYPPQGYPQQPPAQGPPPGYGQQAPAGPPPAQTAPAPAAPGQYGFGDPSTRPAAGDQPAVHQLTASNRLVLIRPIRWNVGGKAFDGVTDEEQMVVDIIVCDGPPINGTVDWNTKVETPFAMGPKQVPIFISEAIINKAVMDRCRDALTNPTTPDTVCGRLVTKPPKAGKGYPWNNLEAASDADKAIAGPIYAAWDQIKAQALQLAASAAQQQGPAGPPPGQYQGSPPAYGTPPVQQPPQYGPPPGYGQQDAPQGPPPGYGQAPPQYGPPPGYQGPPPAPAQDPYAQPGQAPYPPY